MSDTSAPLVATAVVTCCQKALDEIEQKRLEIMANIVKSKIGTKMYADCGHDVPAVYAKLPDNEKMIPAMHRVDDEKRLRLVLELAEAVADVPDLRIQVSLDDFQLIKRFYKKLTVIRFMTGTARTPA